MLCDGQIVLITTQTHSHARTEPQTLSLEVQDLASQSFPFPFSSSSKGRYSHILRRLLCPFTIYVIHRLKRDGKMPQSEIKPLTLSPQSSLDMDLSVDRPILRRLYCQQGADLDELVVYGGLRYHLLLQYNMNAENCVENKLLRRVYDTLDNGDEELLDDASDAFFELMIPFFESDYAKRVGLNGKDPTQTLKLRVFTKNRLNTR